MSEKRKPKFIILLKKPGKKTAKLELFSAKDFNLSKQINKYGKYRLRFKGKWFGEKGKNKNKSIYSWYQITRIIYKSIKL